MGISNKTPMFISGGGEMGQLINAYDWSTSSLGPIDNWPQSLQTTLSIVLQSKFPMFLYWGPDLLCFYNDAYRPSLGSNGKHPMALGAKAKDVWTEIWDVVHPLIVQVLSGKGATWSEDQLIPIYRNGKIEDVYWTFSYSPVTDETGKLGGVFVTCNETTQKVAALKKIEETSKLYIFSIEAAGLATWDLNPTTNRISGNDRLKEWFGLQPEDDIYLDNAISIIAEKDRQKVAAAIEKAMQFSSGGNYDIDYTILNPITKKERRVKAVGCAYFDEKGEVYRFNGTLQDLTESLQALEIRQELYTLVENSVDLMSILKMDGSNNYINKAGQKLLGIEENANVAEIPITDFYTLEQADYIKSVILPTVMEKGIWAGEMSIRNTKTKEIIPLFSNWHLITDKKTGLPVGIGTVMRDLRFELASKKELAENEERLNIAIEATELGMWELDVASDELIYSKKYLQIFGFDENAVPSRKAFKDRIHPDDLRLRNKVMKQAYITGTVDLELRIVLPDESIRWLITKGKVFYNADNEPQKALGTIMDITERKTDEQALQLSLDRFRLLADSMPQIIWTGDATGNIHYFNQAMYNYSGLVPESLIIDGWLKIVHPDDREQNIAKWIDSVTTGKDFLYEHRFRRYDGTYRWQLSRALPQIDDNGIIQMWVGTSTDIHDQKTMSQELELQVELRTKELQQANHELKMMNQELESFAYVASHDLQEPLRKIQTFTSRILQIDGDNISEKGKEYFERMTHSAVRMQTLINDLLTFSRIGTSEKAFLKTDLNELLDKTKRDLHEDFLKSNVCLTTNLLPTLAVIPYQFHQLFTNLLSNSLKFSRKDVIPEISIHASKVNGKDYQSIGLEKNKKYNKIVFTDNGIGFLPEYASRIFEVFQRLHSKTQYEGTGIGLAICKKIVENHHGIIIATGAPDKGARFDIYLPI